MESLFDRLSRAFSYRIILIFFMLFFTVLPSLFIFIVSKEYVKDIVTDKYLNDYLYTIYSQIENNISSLIYDINTLSLYFITQNKFYNTILSKDKSYDEKYHDMEEMVSAFLKENNVIEGISIITKNNMIYHYSSIPISVAFPNDDFVKSIENRTFSVADMSIKFNDKFYIMTGKPFYNYYNNYDIGYLIMYVKEDAFCEMYEDFEVSNSKFFITINNNIISHTDKSLIGSKFFLNDEYFIPENKNLKLGDDFIISKHNIETKMIIPRLTMVSICSNKNFNRMLFNINLSFSILLFIVIIISIIVATFISFNLLREIELLRKSMHCFGEQPIDYEPKFKLNEIHLLENDFKQMTHRIQLLIDRIKQEKEKQHIAELAALQAQINPHFIYNTLDSIAWIMRMKNQNDVYEIICALASFFRISLHGGSNIITVREEIEHLKSYITIEKMRFPDLFDIEIDISPDILDLCMIKIILQPIVENSIKHGFKDRATGGKIYVTGKLTQNNDIEFIITDNGCGMDFDPITNPIKKVHKDSSGYGIINVHQRLFLEYGEGYGLSYSSVVGKGTSVRVLIKNSYN